MRVGDTNANLAITALCLVTLALSALGLLAPVDATLFSGFSRLPSDTPAPDRVVIVDLGTGPELQEQKVSAQLRAVGATAIVAPAAYGRARCAPVISAGLAVRYLSGDAGRCARLSDAAPGGWPEGGALSPDFSIPTSTAIPRFAAEQVLGADFAGSSLAAMVGGRIVLLDRGWSRPVYATPLQRVDGPLNATTLDALMLESLLDRKAVRWARLPYQTLWLFVAAALWLWWLAAQTSQRNIWLRSAALALLSLAASAALMRWGRIFVPQASTLAMMAGMSVWHAAGMRYSVSRQLQRLQALLLQATTRSGHETWKAQVPPEASEWSTLAALASAHFGARRCWMLRLPPESPLLEPAATEPPGASGLDAIGLDAIRSNPGRGSGQGSGQSSGLDYRKPPFSDAMASGRAMELALSLQSADAPAAGASPAQDIDGHRIVLVALRRAGEAYGFMVIELEDSRFTAAPRLLEEIGDYADAAAMRLQRSRHAVRRRPRSRGAATVPDLYAAAADAAHQLEVVRELLAASPQPRATLALDGHVLFSNPAFGDFARTCGISLLSMRLQEMLSALCDMSEADAFRETRRMLLYGAILEHPLSSRFAPAPTVLRAYAAGRDAHRRKDRSDRSAALIAYAIVVELLPSTRPDMRLSALCDAGERLTHDLENEFDALRSLLNGDATPAPERAETLARIDRLQHALDAFGRHLHLERMTDARDRSVCDLQLILESAAHAIFPELQKRGLVLRIEGDPALHAAIAPERARELLDSALSLLAHDAANDSTLSCEARCAAGMSSLRLVNQGFGVPEWHLRDLREHAAAGAKPDDPLEHLLACGKDLTDAGGALIVESALGEGFVVTIRIPTPD